MPTWQQALTALHLPLYDVHWDAAVVLDKGGGKRGDGLIKVGLADGHVMPLTGAFGQIGRKLSLYDVIYVHVVDTKPAKGKSLGGQAQLRVRPGVQGAALVIENKTGRILAMAGSFSYPLSQLNRAVQTERQPGSAMKPLTYLTALEKGLQPNTLVSDEPLTLPPIGAGGRYVIAREQGGFARPEDFWSPRNADNSAGGLYTMRRGLENSVNMVTAHLLQGGINRDPVQSLDDVCATAVAAKIYTDCIRYYPFVLGAQPVHMINLAAFYAAVANEGARPQPHGIDSIELGGHTVYEYPKTPLPFIGAADRTSFYQLKTMLQGVVARGTARGIGALSPYVAGKTGTTEDAVDGWFVGFTNDVTVAVWVGYDNGDGKRRSLGTNATGARVALPIFQPILETIWANGIAPKAPLNGPSREAQLHLVDLPIDYASGNRINGGGRGNFIEHFRLGADGRFNETQYQLIPQEDASASDSQGSQAGGQSGVQPRSQGYWASAPREDDRFANGRSFYPGQGPQPNYPGQPPPNYPGQGPQSRGSQPMARGFFGSFWDGRAN